MVKILREEAKPEDFDRFTQVGKGIRQNNRFVQGSFSCKRSVMLWPKKLYDQSWRTVDQAPNKNKSWQHVQNRTQAFALPCETFSTTNRQCDVSCWSQYWSFCWCCYIYVGYNVDIYIYVDIQFIGARHMGKHKPSKRYVGSGQVLQLLSNAFPSWGGRCKSQNLLINHRLFKYNWL